MNARDTMMRAEAKRSNDAIERASKALTEVMERADASILGATDVVSGTVSDRLERIQQEAKHEVVLMRVRIIGHYGEKYIYRNVRGKTHTGTYYDNHQRKAKTYRTNRRCESFLALSGNEVDLLLREYERALDKELPLPKSYCWVVTIVEGEDGRKDFRYTHRRRPRNYTA